MLKFRNIPLFTALFTLVCSPAAAQNFVDMKETAIVRIVERDYAGFIRQKEILNDNHSYLKYETGDGLQTLLIFLDQKGVCTEVRLSFDKSVYVEKLGMLNKMYSNSGNGLWTDKRGGKEYIITLADENWYYTLKFKGTGNSF